MSACGTLETCRRTVTMSGYRGRAEIIGTWPNRRFWTRNGRPPVFESIGEHIDAGVFKRYAVTADPHQNGSEKSRSCLPWGEPGGTGRHSKPEESPADIVRDGDSGRKCSRAAESVVWPVFQTPHLPSPIPLGNRDYPRVVNVARKIVEHRSNGVFSLMV